MQWKSRRLRDIWAIKWGDKQEKKTVILSFAVCRANWDHVAYRPSKYPLWIPIIHVQNRSLKKIRITYPAFPFHFGNFIWIWCCLKLDFLRSVDQQSIYWMRCQWMPMLFKGGSVRNSTKFTNSQTTTTIRLLSAESTTQRINHQQKKKKVYRIDRSFTLSLQHQIHLQRRKKNYKISNNRLKWCPFGKDSVHEMVRCQMKCRQFSCISDLNRTGEWIYWEQCSYNNETEHAN